MCLVRSVNHLCDLTVSKKDRTFSTKALMMDLPEYLIDLRHAATHGEIPDIYLTSKGIFDLYEWLVRTYWDKQYEYYMAETEATLN